MKDVDTIGTHTDGHAHHHHEHGHEHHHHDEPMSQEEVVAQLLVLGQVALDNQDFESAVQAYASALQLEPDKTALYNLGTLYARGLGTRRDYVEAARLFHKAQLQGNVRAGQLCGKCMMDHLHEGFDDRSPADLYAAMAVFVSRVYPEALDAQAEVNRGLYAVAATHFDRGEYAEAAKVWRAAAEFGGDGHAQYYLGALYHEGAGVERNDLAALYWFDVASDNGAVALAIGERDNILEACRQSLSEEDFRQTMAMLADWCETGTPDVPADAAKAAQWRSFA